MSKQYRFTIMARMDNNKSTSMYNNIIARNTIEAKNKFKAMFPNTAVNIVSCVRHEEHPEFSKQTDRSNKNSKSDNDSSSLGGILLGAAATAGIGLAMSLFKKK